MKILDRRFVAAVIVMLAVLLTPANIFSCAYGALEPVFTLAEGPEPPLDSFTQGTLGIVLPSYERSFLVVAYRYLASKPLSKAEQMAFEQAWVAPQGNDFEPSAPVDAQIYTWEKARFAALGPAPIPRHDIKAFRSVRNGWEQYLNCGGNAFVTAADTATRIAKTFGVGSAAVRDWVQAQDTVFDNCGPVEAQAASKGTTQPSAYLPKATVKDAALNLDRQYQIAAANFYAGDFQAAAQQFQQIANEHDSPWWTWAPYLVARCYIREATLNESPSYPDRDPSAPTFNLNQMAAAEKQLQEILKNPALASIHPASQKLLNYVEIRLHPDHRLYELGQQLAGRAPAADITQDLYDFNWIIRRQVWASGDVTTPKFAQWHADLAKRGLLDDLTDWVLTFKEHTPVARAHAVERWRTTNSELWLMAALSMANATDPNAAALENAAAAVAPTSPGYEMAVYYRARLLAGQNKQEAARKLLAANLPRFEKGSLSSYNLLLSVRFEVAENFHQLLELAPRTPVEYATTGCDDCGTSGGPESDGQTKPLPKRLDGDSAVIFNQRLPLSMLSEAATETVLPSDLRTVIGTASWTRAAILDDATAIKALTPVLVDAHPELRDYVKDYDAAASEDARTFAATWMLLHFPGMQPFIWGGAFRETKFDKIDDFRDNWWCGNPFPTKTLPPNTVRYGNGPWVDRATGKPAVPLPVAPLPFPSFLTATQRANAEEQRRKLSTLASGPDYIGTVVLAWAKSHPDDKRLPEALHLVVRATRYGCADDKTGPISKQAYDLLHARFPNSEWAKKTPYWFK